MTNRPTNLEPAVGRLLVTAEGYTWVITVVHPDGALDLHDPSPTAYEERNAAVHTGDWIAADMDTLRAYARLTGLELR
jgi:hypothetical protein